MSKLPLRKPENAPAWAFWWDSNNVHGWVCDSDAWAIVMAANTHIEDLVHRARQAQGSEESYGLRAEHVGVRTLADHARAYGLAWMFSMTEPRVHWRPHQYFVVWSLPGSRGLYLSVWRAMFVVGPPWEWLNIRDLPTRWRIGIGPFSFSWWR